MVERPHACGEKNWEMSFPIFWRAEVLLAEEKIGTGAGWLIRTGFRPVSDRFQTSGLSDLRIVPATVSFRLQSPCDRVLSGAQSNVGCTVSCRVHSVISDMHLP